MDHKRTLWVAWEMCSQTGTMVSSYSFAEWQPLNLITRMAHLLSNNHRRNNNINQKINADCEKFLLCFICVIMLVTNKIKIILLYKKEKI